MKALLSYLISMIKIMLCRQKLKNFLPLIFNNIDKVMPAFLADGTPDEIQELIARSIHVATGKNPTQIEIETVINIYSPIAAVSKAIGR